MPPDWKASHIFRAATRNGHEDVLDVLHSRFNLTPRWLLETIRSAADAGHIDLALKLYRQLPLCCSKRMFIEAANDIAWRSVETEKENWRELDVAP